MRVLIIGFNGFIGQSIARFAPAQKTYGLSRSREPGSGTHAIYLSGDRSKPDQLRQIVLERKIDVVVDVIPMVVADTQPLLDCLDGAIDQYVMISSCDVYANYELLHRRGSGKAVTGAIDEDAPLRTTAFPYRESRPRSVDDPDKHLDDYDKIPLEAAVQRLTSTWTILRLPMVYGPGDKQRRFRWAIAPMLSGEEELIVPRRWAHWLTTYGYIENVGAAVAAAIGCEQARNRIFNVAEETPVSQIAWARKFAEVSGWRGEIVLTDDPNDPFQQRLGGLDLSVPFNIDGTRLRRTLGFSDVVDETTALEQTIASEASV